ncbi:CapA family protein [Deinococcus sp. HMF7604]|uniref:CapA family protein n=1 Tax=Deinococcus betulae TaxID=2873312 RepID=UPI001CCDA107|nr:CapA family protein [Deinococcus betulae]MBZ9750455.1 CapA family protein [Deinococcus betulae]
MTLPVLVAFLLTAGGRETPTPVLALAGDVSLARGVAQANAGSWAAALQGVRPALQADASAANLESPLTDAPRVTTGIDLRAPVAAVAALHPLTHLSVENNHAGDGGVAGQRRSQQMLRAAHLSPITRTLSLSRVGNRMVAWVAYLDDGRTPPPLGAVREGARRAEVVVVLPHWGAEYGRSTPRQRAQARQLAAAGATVVAGSGPHVLQGHEVLTGPGGRVLVLYSLGNLLFDQTLPAARLGAVVRVPLADVTRACAVPTRTRAGRALRAAGEDRRTALTRLGLPACPEGT